MPQAAGLRLVVAGTRRAVEISPLAQWFWLPANSGRDLVKHMVNILAKLKVRDFEAWLATFRKYARQRADFGCRSETVYWSHQSHGASEVYVIVDWSSRRAFEDYMGWLQPQEIPEESGVVGTPDHVVLGERAA